MGNLPFLGPAVVAGSEGDLLNSIVQIAAEDWIEVVERCRERYQQDDSRSADTRLRTSEVREIMIPIVGEEATESVLENFQLQHEEGELERSVDTIELFGTFVVLGTSADLTAKCSTLYHVRLVAMGSTAPHTLRGMAVVSLLTRLMKGVRGITLLE